jgi:hypothetical protein
VATVVQTPLKEQDMRHIEELPIKDDRSVLIWLKSRSPVVFLGILLLCVCSVWVILTAVAVKLLSPPLREWVESTALIPVYPGAERVDKLSRSSVYVGSCCQAYQLAYYTPEPMDTVRLFYESRIGKSFVDGFKYPPHQNFQDFDEFPSCMSVFFCRPDCETDGHTAESVYLLDADEPLTKEGTVVIFQVHVEIDTYGFDPPPDATAIKPP